MQAIEITVIVCTYNRCRSLANALESAAALILPDSVQWEVLVVDNNSRDQTREVVEEFCRRYPGRFRYLFEPKQGKSNALNAGIRDARGDILAFTDDDVIVEPAWLDNLTAALRHGDWVGSGGRVVPLWTTSPPSWLSLEAQHALAPLANFDLGPDARQLSETPFGCNMAVRKAMFEKYGGFRPDLGPTTESDFRQWSHKLPPRNSEDSEFGSRLLAAGERLRYEPSAVVSHPVAENRVQKQYFLAWWFEKGRADVLRSGAPAGAKCWHGIPIRDFGRLMVWVLRWISTVEPRQRFANKVNVWTIAGRMLESYRQPKPNSPWQNPLPHGRGSEPRA
jgi:glycosyltransferase involved in cell wall biosynthesis